MLCNLHNYVAGGWMHVTAEAHGLQASGWVSYRYSDMMDLQKFDELYDAMQVEDHASPLVTFFWF